MSSAMVRGLKLDVGWDSGGWGQWCGMVNHIGLALAFGGLRPPFF